MRHGIDGLSLVLGLVFGLVAVAGLNGWITPEVLRVEWILPAGLVLLGLVLLGLVVSVVGRRRTPALDHATDESRNGTPDPTETD